MGNQALVKTIFEWTHFHIYLAGPIDAAWDGGSEWRRDLTERLVNRLGFTRRSIFSPTKKPLSNTYINLDNEAELMREKREAEDWDGLCEIVSEIAHLDLRLCDKSDLIIAHFPYGKDGRRTYTYGTMHEIVSSRQQKKPVLVVWPGGKSTCSGWLMWLVGHENIFETFEELEDHLLKMSEGKIAYNAREWLLFDYDKHLNERSP